MPDKLMIGLKDAILALKDEVAQLKTAKAGMAEATQVTVKDWLRVRREVARVVKTRSSTSASEAIAEALMSEGYVDVEAVLGQLPIAPEGLRVIEAAIEGDH